MGLRRPPEASGGLWEASGGLWEAWPRPGLAWARPQNHYHRLETGVLAGWPGLRRPPRRPPGPSQGPGRPPRASRAWLGPWAQGPGQRAWNLF